MRLKIISKKPYVFINFCGWNKFHTNQIYIFGMIKLLWKLSLLTKGTGSDRCSVLASLQTVTKKTTKLHSIHNISEIVCKIKHVWFINKFPCTQTLGHGGCAIRLFIKEGGPRPQPSPRPAVTTMSLVMDPWLPVWEQSPWKASGRICSVFHQGKTL